MLLFNDHENVLFQSNSIFIPFNIFSKYHLINDEKDAQWHQINNFALIHFLSSIFGKAQMID